MKNEDTLLRDLDNLGISNEIDFKFQHVKEETPERWRYDVEYQHTPDEEYSWCLSYNDKHHNTLVSVDILYGHSTEFISVNIFENYNFQNSDKVFEISMLFRNKTEIILGCPQKDELYLSIINGNEKPKHYKKHINKRSYSIVNSFYVKGNTLSHSFFKTLNKLRKVDKKIDKDLTNILL